MRKNKRVILHFLEFLPESIFLIAMEGGRAPNTIYYGAEKTDTGFGAAKVIGFD